MSIVSFKKMMKDARDGKYAVGYFEAWNLESLLAVCDAAENKRSPVIIGFSGVDFPNYSYKLNNVLDVYLQLTNLLANNLTINSCTIFNESSSIDFIKRAISYGTGVVMYTDYCSNYNDFKKMICDITHEAHKNNVFVEAEIDEQIGLGKSFIKKPDKISLTDPELAKSFIEETQIDALAVNIGQVSMIGEQKVHLDFKRLEELNNKINIPLVLHGGSSIYEEDIKKAVKEGICKINIGKEVKEAYFKTLKELCIKADKEGYNPYKIVGSGLSEDVLDRARLATQKIVEELMDILGSSGKS